MIKIAYSIWTFGQLLSADERSEEQRKQACLRISGNKQDKKEINHVGVKQRVHIQRNL